MYRLIIEHIVRRVILEARTQSLTRKVRDAIVASDTSHIKAAQKPNRVFAPDLSTEDLINKIEALYKVDDIGDEDPEDFDDVSEDADYESESGDTNAMGDTDAMNIEAKMDLRDKGKGTLDQKEKIIEKLQYAIEDYLEDLGLRELSDEEKPKFQKGLGFTKTTPEDAFMNKVRIGFHFLTPDEDPRRNDPRHDDQEVHYSLRIYKPNERFNIGTLRGFIKQAKAEAHAKEFRFFDKLNRSNQDILFNVTVR